LTIKASDVQADFLNALTREEKAVWVFLVNGIKLMGQFLELDQYVLALQSPTGSDGVQNRCSNRLQSACCEHRRTRDRLATSRERLPTNRRTH